MEENDIKTWYFVEDKFPDKNGIYYGRCGIKGKEFLVYFEDGKWYKRISGHEEALLTHWRKTNRHLQ